MLANRNLLARNGTPERKLKGWETEEMLRTMDTENVEQKPRILLALLVICLSNLVLFIPQAIFLLRPRLFASGGTPAGEGGGYFVMMVPFIVWPILSIQGVVNLVLMVKHARSVRDGLAPAATGKIAVLLYFLWGVALLAFVPMWIWAIVNKIL